MLSRIPFELIHSLRSSLASWPVSVVLNLFEPTRYLWLSFSAIASHAAVPFLSCAATACVLATPMDRTTTATATATFLLKKELIIIRTIVVVVVVLIVVVRLDSSAFCPGPPQRGRPSFLSTAAMVTNVIHSDRLVI